MLSSPYYLNVLQVYGVHLLCVLSGMLSSLYYLSVFLVFGLNLCMSHPTC